MKSLAMARSAWRYADKKIHRLICGEIECECDNTPNCEWHKAEKLFEYAHRQLNKGAKK